PTWWLVITRPSAETNEPEPPLLKRTDDFWTCSSHLSVASKLYFSLRYFLGAWLNSHMPSSANAGGVTSSAAASSPQVRLVIASPLLVQGALHAGPGERRGVSP